MSINYKYLVIAAELVLMGWVGLSYAGSWGTAKTQDMEFTIMPEVTSSLKWEPASGLHGVGGSMSSDVAVGSFHISVSDGFHIGARFADEFLQSGQDTLHGFAATEDGSHKVKLYLTPGVNTVVKDDPSFTAGAGRIIYGPDGGTFLVKVDGDQKVTPGDYTSRVAFATWYE
ncbi:hypothetical protein C3432_19560 [Citrobacter amalonaticus]|uniref:Uncharacterized protein n=1 Tax=Citrobacter amalonaticus TaxID=35703 RepID=A0A2S4RXM3_CITAM|nr:hypothetical protein [Citrobacter amalonaticus]POT56175.1 hypothetical protein C3432_19560 [Citrobacter amalonaticus]POT74484.1 hypothetical protein C3436_17200 [Citrobacter amalonaticus]POU65283.1 hypothetical protein C3430_13940 [Citrobacter amalonaticus]POV04118.1 hypothetical protein C3424_18880 [Citrobacter amalonaticus]